jgi:hypothetical protein
VVQTTKPIARGKPRSQPLFLLRVQKRHSVEIVLRRNYSDESGYKHRRLPEHRPEPEKKYKFLWGVPFAVALALFGASMQVIFAIREVTNTTINYNNDESKDYRI